MSLPKQCVLGLLVLPLLPLLALAKDDPGVDALHRRLLTLQSDPAAADVARYEQLQAQQAIAALADAKRRDREMLEFLADRRVEIAELAVRTALAKRQLDRLDGIRKDLMIESSRREAARAQQEAERLRVQAQIRAEEAERLRQAAEQETLARQDAEQALNDMAGKQAAKRNAAQQKAAQLAREEAELMAGAKMPASRLDARGEVFAFGGDAFDGKNILSNEAINQLKALAAYLQIAKKARVNIVGYDDDPATAKKRAEAVRDALAAAGAGSGRLQVNSVGGAVGKARTAEVVVAP